MAGTVAITTPRVGDGFVKKLVFTWTSDAAGAVSGTDTLPIDGELLRLVTNPGTPAPTDNYDIVINDADGVDVLGGVGANRDTVNSEQVVPIIETVVGANTYGSKNYVDGPLSLVISNAGDTKSGVCTLYYR